MKTLNTVVKRFLSDFLEHSEGGRSFKTRVRLATRENLPEKPIVHPYLARLKYMYVEASFLCNLSCRMCPRLLEGHKEGLMPLERFQRLLPLFPHLELVVLTGYGEPLIHPRLPEFVSMIRTAGPKPRLSTNGTILNRQKGEALIEAGLDNLQFSIDAGTAETYEKIRVGAKWDRVLANAEAFHKLCEEHKVDIGTGWVCVVMQDNWRELPKAVRQAVDSGFKLFVAKFIERNALDYEQHQNMHDNDGRLLVDQQEYDAVMEECREIAAATGIEFRLHPFHYGIAGACLADSLQAFFVDWMGNISPCCHLPVRNEMDNFPEHSFGNIDEQDIMEILLGPRALKFWDLWSRKMIPAVCTGCYQVKRLPDGESYLSIGKRR